MFGTKVPKVRRPFVGDIDIEREERRMHKRLYSQGGNMKR